MMHRTGCAIHGSFSACFAIAPSGGLADRSGCTGLSAAPGGGLVEKGDYAGPDACHGKRLRQAIGCVGRESCKSITVAPSRLLRRATSSQLGAWLRRAESLERRLRRIRQLRKCLGFAGMVACRARMHLGWVHSCAKPAAAPGMAAVRNGLRRARQLR